MALSGNRLETGSRRRSAADDILNAAERLAQTRGFNGFSYADIGEQLAITKASIHYHFRSKADLGCALIARYHEAFSRALETIAVDVASSFARLERYVELYDRVMLDDRMCLCGMLAAEFTTLPEAMQAALRRFFDANEVWLNEQFVRGRDKGELRFRGSGEERARLLLATLEGAMLVARTSRDSNWFRSSARLALADLTEARLTS